MHAAERALAWQVWWPHRRGLAVVALIFAAVAVIFQTIPAGGLEKKHGYLCFFQLIFALIYVAAIFAFGFESALESGESGYPSRLFTLPVRTIALVGWPMAQGAAAVALLWTVSTYLVLRPSGVDISAWTLALQAAAFVAVLQALLWWPFGIPWARVVIALLVLPVLALAPMLADALGFAETDLRIAFAVLLPLAFGAAVAGVARARRGDTPRWSWTPARRTKTPRTRPAFASPMRALLWLERRRNLMTFIILVACSAPLILAMGFAVEETVENQVKLTVNFLFIPILMAPIIGSVFGRVGTSPKNPYLLTPFTAAKPVTTMSLVVAKLKTAALSAAAAWAIVLACAAVWMAQTGLYRQIPDAWRWASDAGRAGKVAAGLVLGGSVLFLLTWRLMVDNLCVSLTGRSWLFKASMVLHGVVITAAAVIGAQYVDNPPSFRAALDSLPWMLGALVALKALGAAWAIGALVRRRIVAQHGMARLLGAWLLAGGALFGLARWVIPAALIPTVTLALVVILLVPMARLAAAPLALDYNRHR